MIGSAFLETRAAILLAADTLGLGAAGFLNVRLSQNSVNPTRNTVLGDYTEATFNGYAPIITTAAGATVIIDPATNDQLLVIPPPAGGWIWTVNGSTGLPQTIYNVYVQLAAAGLNYLGGAVLDPAQALSVIGDGVLVKPLAFRLVAGFLSSPL